LIRVRPQDLTRAGVERVGRTVGVDAHGLPLLDDGRSVDVANVIWCTGYTPGFEWIDLPDVHGEDAHEPRHERGVVTSQPGLYFVGLEFEYALSSSMVQGVSRDAERIVRGITQAARDSRSASLRHTRGSALPRAAAQTHPAG
jgi:putative flavoprotein involved in K+ transport